MFKNRAFLVKPVKDDADDHPTWVWSPSDYSNLIEQITKNAAMIIGIYYGGDILREVIIHAAKTQIK